MLSINDNKYNMRKLNILKGILDLFWIFMYPIIPVLILFIPYMFFAKKVVDINFNLNGLLVSVQDFTSKILISLLIISSLIVFYNLFLFRKIISHFKLLKIFDTYIIKTFLKMGYLFIISAFINGLSTLIYKVKYFSKIEFSFGISSFWVLIILGLFLVTLSEIFKIAKQAKEENELTI